MFSPIVLDEQTALTFSLQQGLIDNCQICSCWESMFVVQDNSKKSKMIWKCPECKSRRSILHGSIFSDSNLRMNTILLIIYCWAKEFSCKSSSNECGVSGKTIGEIFSKI